MPFFSLKLSAPILRAIDDKGYITPTSIQTQTIPAILAGRDVMAAAQTGTGKTAGFSLPMLQRLANGAKAKANQIRGLVLTPTRELAVQVAESIALYGQHLPLKTAVVYGGVKINPQMMQLRGGVDVLVATPGRLLDLFDRNAVKLSQIEILVLDEADRMLDLGFSDDINTILALLPKKRQNLLFSATFSSDIRRLANELLNNPVRIEAGPRNSAPKSVKQMVYEVDKARKAALLSHLVCHGQWQQVLVFTRTKKNADLLVRQLKADTIVAAAIHGDKSQAERSRVLADFKANTIRVLVATDVAARGIDISELPHVINFDLPTVPGDYIHRIGRTGRAGSEGEAISLVCADEVQMLAAIESLIRQTLVREVESSFIPKHPVPLTVLRAARPKKPKKTKKSKHELVPQLDGRQTVEEQTSGHKKPRWVGKPQDTENRKAAHGRRGRQRREGGAVTAPSSTKRRSVKSNR